MEYKLIKKFLPELAIIDNNENVPDYVEASDLEAELAKGVEVFGDYEDIRDAAFTTSKVEGVDTHSGLLLNYKPLESSKPVSREEIESLEHELKRKQADQWQLNIIKRILKNGVKND